MKKIVWENKSNGQLCVTIPKSSGIKVGEVVSIEQKKVKTIVYSFVVADLFHYGHLQFLEHANELGDYHICGVLTDKAVLEYRKPTIANFEERKAIISNLRCVDMVIAQTSKSPLENLKKIHEQFKNSKLILTHASNWKKIPGEEFVKQIGGKVVKPTYYKKLSDDKIIKEIKKG
jgi:phosphoenolpyruvate phosphomutase|tara:strand:- start:3846 stop:4370 length:525 start_codon:yes stop_codon:yes gene_type:complete